MVDILALGEAMVRSTRPAPRTDVSTCRASAATPRTSRSRRRARERAPATYPRSATTSTAPCCARCGARKASTTPACAATPTPIPPSTSSPMTRRAITSLLPAGLGRQPHGRGAAAACAESPPRRVLHLSGISLAISESAREAGFAAIATARRAGVKVSFDTNHRPRLWSLALARTTITAAIAQSDICLPSFDDLAVLTGLDSPEAMVEHCLGLGAARRRAQARRPRRLAGRRASRRIRIPPHPCRPVDATGAGDAFGGAFVARLRRRRRPGARRPLCSGGRGAIDRGLRRGRADPARGARARRRSAPPDRSLLGGRLEVGQPGLEVLADHLVHVDDDAHR